MARRDGTGPMGQGAMTGRGMGYCGSGLGKGFNTPRGMGMRGRGFRCRSGFGAYFAEEPMNTISEKEWLTEEKAILEDRLNLIKKELDSLGDE